MEKEIPPSCKHADQMREGNERYMRDEGKGVKPEDGEWVKDRVIVNVFYTRHLKETLAYLDACSGLLLLFLIILMSLIIFTPLNQFYTVEK